MLLKIHLNVNYKHIITKLDSINYTKLNVMKHFITHLNRVKRVVQRSIPFSWICSSPVSVLFSFNTMSKCNIFITLKLSLCIYFPIVKIVFGWKNVLQTWISVVCTFAGCQVKILHIFGWNGNKKSSGRNSPVWPKLKQQKKRNTAPF